MSAEPSTTVRKISPMLAVADIAETLDFYIGILGFSVTMLSDEYSIVERDGATIHFMKAADESVMQAVRGHAEIYIEVENIHPLWEKVKALKSTSGYKITELMERPYGMTEFHIEDPNQCLVFVGQETSLTHS